MTIVTQRFVTLWRYLRRTVTVWAFVLISMVGMTVVALYVAKISADTAADASGCIAASMPDAQRAAVRGLNLAEYTVVHEQFSLNAIEYCRLTPEALRNAVVIASGRSARERASGAGGLWIRFERFVDRILMPQAYDIDVLNR